MDDKDEFSQELEDYIGQRTKSRFNIGELFGRLKPKKKMPEKVEGFEMQEEEKIVEEPAEEVINEPEELTTKEKGNVVKFLEKVGLISQEENESKAQQLLEKDETKDDLREVAKITLAVIKQLPEDQMGAFKSSPDFERLKTVLRKHGLIK